MSEKPEIERLRVLHDLATQFAVPDGMQRELRSQLSDESQQSIARFVSGFKIEDWFEWVFCSMPWVKLIHGLDQQQFPKRSKDLFQVPDFITLVETSALTHQALLVDVKRVADKKQTLKLPDAQIALCKQYAAVLSTPLVFAVFWDSFSAWTLNTVDTFERKSSSRTLSVLRAIEYDCSSILGDISYLVPPTLVRTSTFSKSHITPSSVRHDQYGRLVSDALTLGDRHVQLNILESAAIDSMLTMKLHNKAETGGETKLVEVTDEFHLLKLSSWITRHIGLWGVEPSEEYAHAASHTIAHLMDKLGCSVQHMFPTDRTDDLSRISDLFQSKTRN